MANSQTYVVQTIFKGDHSNLSGAIKRNTTLMQGFSNKSTQAFSSVRSGVMSVKNLIAGGLGVVGITSALQKMKGVADDVFKEFRSFETESIFAAKKFGILDDSQKVEEMKKRARELGKVTQYTATEVMGLFSEIAGQNFQYEEVEGLTNSILNFATATKQTPGEAALIALNAMNTAGLKTKDPAQNIKNLQRVTDAMTKSADLSAVKVPAMADAIRQVGPVAKMAGFSIENMLSFFAAMGDEALQSGKAGTALKTVIASLAAPVPKVIKMWQKMRVEFEDGKGKLLGVDKIFENVIKKANELEGTEKIRFLSDSFGREGMVAAGIVAENTDKIVNLNKELKNATGYSKEFADALSGTVDFKIASLGSSVVELGLKIMDHFGDKIPGGIQGMIDKINNINVDRAFKDIEDSYNKYTKPAFHGFKGQVKGITEEFKNLIAEIKNYIDVLTGAGADSEEFRMIMEFIGATIGWVIKMGLRAFTNFYHFAAAMLKGVKDLFVDFAGFVKECWILVYDLMTGQWDKLWIDLGQVILSATKFILNQIFDFAALITTTIDNVYRTFTGKDLGYTTELRKLQKDITKPMERAEAPKTFRKKPKKDKEPVLTPTADYTKSVLKPQKQEVTIRFENLPKGTTIAQKGDEIVKLDKNNLGRNE